MGVGLSAAAENVFTVDVIVSVMMRIQTAAAQGSACCHFSSGVNAVDFCLPYPPSR